MNSIASPSAAKVFLASTAWIIEVLIVVALLIFANYGLKQFVKYLRRRSLSAAYIWREKLDEIIYLPIHIMLWIVAVAYVLIVVAERFDFAGTVTYLSSFRNAAIIGCLTWLLLRWIKEVQQSYKIIDPGMAQILGRLSSFAILLLSSLLVLQILGLNIMPLIAFGGVGAAALGFAAKDVIANFFGGLMVHITRPFTIGDLILLPDRNIEGHVEAMGWYLTSIRDKDKRPVYLPNAFFSTSLVINSSRMSHRRFLEKITLRTEDISKVEQIVEKIKRMLSSHPHIDHNLPIIVSFDEFKDYSLAIYIEVYSLMTRLDEFQSVKQDILLKIYKILSEYNAEMPLPTTLIYHKAH